MTGALEKVLAWMAATHGDDYARNFKTFFGDSKVVRPDGAPLPIYHGTSDDIEEFDHWYARNKKDPGWLGEGFYATPLPRIADSYATLKPIGNADGPLVMPLWAALDNPLEVELAQKQRFSPEDARAFTASALDRGHDGVIARTPLGEIAEVNTFFPSRFKSSSGNRGTFSRLDPRLNYRSGGPIRRFGEGGYDDSDRDSYGGAFGGGDDPRDQGPGDERSGYSDNQSDSDDPGQDYLDDLSDYLGGKDPTGGLRTVDDFTERAYGSAGRGASDRALDFIGGIPNKIGNALQNIDWTKTLVNGIVSLNPITGPVIGPLNSLGALFDFSVGDWASKQAKTGYTTEQDPQGFSRYMTEDGLGFNTLKDLPGYEDPTLGSDAAPPPTFGGALSMAAGAAPVAPEVAVAPMSYALDRTLKQPTDPNAYLGYGAKPFSFYAEGGSVGATHDRGYSQLPGYIEAFGQHVPAGTVMLPDEDLGDLRWEDGLPSAPNIGAQLLYDLKTLPAYFTPAAPVAAASDLLEGFTSGNPLQAGLSAFGLPGKVAAPAIIGTGVMASDTAAAGAPWYSKLDAVLDSLKTRKAAPEQWRGELLNKGVKPEELDWRFDRNSPFEAGKPVTLDDLKAHLAKNELLPEEVVRSGGNESEEFSQPVLDDLFDTLSNDVTRKLQRDLDPDEAQHLRNLVEDIALTGGHGRSFQAIDSYLSDLSPVSYHPNAEVNFYDAQDARGIYRGMGDTRFSDYQLPGGENYKELLLTLPAKGADNKAYESFANKMRAKYDDNFMDYVTPAERAELDRLGTPPAAFHKSHWDEPNVLAHVRYNDRMTRGPDGAPQKTLFLEEIQSDWHQQGRDKGYRSDVDSSLQQVIDAEKKMNIAGQRGEFTGTSLDENHPAIQAYRAESARHNKLYGTSSGIPDAPLKKSWHEAAFRRMVKEAVDKGYDRIAWTTGDQQNDRYSLIHHISKIEWSPQHQRLYGVRHGNNRSDKLADNVTAENLADYVGKEIAQKLINQSDNPSMNRELRGVDLEFGGEGMKGFYDDILPKYASKLGKRYGAKVGKTEIEVPGMDEVGTGGPDKSRKETIHVMDLTPQLKEAVKKEGVPFFGLAGAPAAPALMEGDDER